MSIHINVTESDMGMFMINTIHIMDDVQQIIESEHIENSHND